MIHGIHRLSLIALVSLPVACASRIETSEVGPEGPMVQLHATDSQLVPDRIEAAPGQVIHIELTNEGKAVHSLVFDLPGGNQSMGNVLEPGGTGSMRVVAPARPGAYDFYSPVGKDREQGLKGTLVVTVVGSVKIKPQSRRR